MLSFVSQLIVHYIPTAIDDIMLSVATNLIYATYHFGIIFITSKVIDARKDVDYNTAIWSFLTLNFISGMVKLFLIWNIVDNNNNLSDVIRLGSSLLTISTLIILWFMVPSFIKLPSNKNLAELNIDLQHKVRERDEALHALQAEKNEKEKAQNTLLQSQKMEAIGQLTGGIAHDFNNLLMAISGSLELIKTNPKSERVDRWLGTGIDAVTRAAHLTAQLLTFSRVQKLQLKEIELRPSLTTAVGLVKRTLGSNIKVTLGDIDDVSIMMDATQFELAILNLSLNARDAMPQGGQLLLSTNLDDHCIEINVTDTGTGIPDDVVSRVFEPFFTTKDVGKGTGLGLSMVYGMATQSGGDVYIKKTSSTGTTITVSFPIVEKKPIVPTSDIIEKTISPCPSKHILIIDDDVDVRHTLQDILMSMGHKAVCCEDGVEALNCMKTVKPDLVLIDFIMPMMNGAQVAQAARLIHADLNIVFITGYSESASLKNQTVLKKPFKMDDIKTLLNGIFLQSNLT